MLVDKGLLKYDEKVSTYWPEFASNGKCEIKIEDVFATSNQYGKPGSNNQILDKMVLL